MVWFVLPEYFLESGSFSKRMTDVKRKSLDKSGSTER